MVIVYIHIIGYIIADGRGGSLLMIIVLQTRGLA